MSLDLIGFLKDGKYRLKVLEELEKRPLLPSELAEILDINRASVSRVLKDLREKELVNFTSNNTRTILYSISETGKKIIGIINDR